MKIENRKKTRALTRFFFTFVLTFVLFSCDSPPDDNAKHPSADSTARSSDSTMTDSALQKSEFEKAPFQKFLKKYKGQILSYNHDTMDDVTGEGFKQRMHSDIHQDGNNFIVHNQIWRERELIWSDTLKVDPGFCQYFMWGGDSTSVIKYKPWSWLYSAIYYTRFVEEYKPHSNDELSLFQEGSKADSLYWLKELKQYKGKLVIQGMADQDIYIWDKRCGQFILYYSP